MKKGLLLSLGFSSFILADKAEIYIDMSSVLLNYTDNGSVIDFQSTEFRGREL